MESGVAGEPTAFIASYGHGKPVIGILGEFDALPGLSQKPLPQREPVVPNAPGHGCGHNLLGSGAALAAMAVKEYMEMNHVSGTLRYYGTPAEEGGSGKVFMVRAGLFKDVDVVLHWHPGDRNNVNNGGTLAIISAKVSLGACECKRLILLWLAMLFVFRFVDYLLLHTPHNCPAIGARTARTVALSSGSSSRTFPGISF